ncbi:MAG: hypothetical protein K2Y42_01435 [Hyphomicrobium sp.]|jgi:hypothetical protein|uniref:hypothetical protein n=1 Tax=Hyphomicrobium sp. TaxID=82 RepID=UPI0025BEF0F8|nr:hypothetical protein [Hyphomicrobium sp.]MBX9861389.1 hypothetical protein [Hyphomicrobium sp.]
MRIWEPFLRRHFAGGSAAGAVLCMLAVCGLAAAATFARAGEDAPMAGLVEVKLGLNSMNKTDRATLWRRVDEYATVDALQEFCGRKLNLQRRTWAAVSPCVEVASLRKVAAVFRTKKSEYIKGWETAHGDPEKKKALCDTWRPKLLEYQKVLDAHISEAATMCSACLFC